MTTPCSPEAAYREVTEGPDDACLSSGAFYAPSPDEGVREAPGATYGALAHLGGVFIAKPQ